MNPLERFVKQFGCTQVPEHKQEGTIWISKTTSPHTKPKPFSKGLELGRIHRKKFKPTPALLWKIYSGATKTATLNEKGTWLFLCGRDAFFENVLSCSASEGPVLVLDEHHECIGWGTANDKGMIKNKLDFGEYLRREN